MQRLGIPFVVAAPQFDEDVLKAQEPDLAKLAAGLARGKAESLAKEQTIVIGSDQIVQCQGQRMGKPGTAQRACEQLAFLAGKTHEILTAVYVTYQGDGFQILDVSRIKMHPLSAEQIAAYVERDQPLDCAGAYKIERHGISLFEKVESEDFTAIQGLPLLKLSHILRGLGWTLPPAQFSGETKR